MANFYKLQEVLNGDNVKLTAQQRLEILEEVREDWRRITDQHSVKTYEGWHESGLPSFEDYCFPGDKVDDDMVQYFVDSVPPVLMLSFCTQAGEPYSIELDEQGVKRPTFATFHDLGGGYWQFDGYCFYKENTNRCTRKPRIEELIDEAKREAEEELIKADKRCHYSESEGLR